MLAAAAGSLRPSSWCNAETPIRSSSASQRARTAASEPGNSKWSTIARTYRAEPPTTIGDAPRVLTLGGAGIGVLNCYEDVLDHYGRAVAAQGPDYLVNVTNDAWFGNTSEPILHHMVARMRSIETRRDLVRAVNTGVSGHVAATGENVVLTETFVATTFVTTVAKLGAAEGTVGRTVYVRIGRAFEWLALALLLGLGFYAYRSRLARNGAVSENPQMRPSEAEAQAEDAAPKDL